MIALREGLLNKKNIKDIKIHKKDLKTGDVIHLKDGSIGVFIKKMEDSPECYYYFFDDDEGQGIVLYYETFEEEKFSYDLIHNYNENLVHSDDDSLSVERVERGKCPKNIIEDESKLWKWFKENY